MYLQKTDQAIRELAQRDRKLVLKARALLLLADGKKSDIELLTMVQADAALVDSLITQGYLERAAPAAATRTPPKREAPMAVPPARTVDAATSETAKASNSNDPPSTSFQDSALTTQKIRVAADAFDGKRSLATARMFLFDLTERMFARRDPALAQGLRERFREARDRASMMDVARDLLRHIEEQAGASRADEVSARLSMLLPDEIPA
jgi:hypothetical protein